MIGAISRLFVDKGFAFITREDGQDYFAHRSALRNGTRSEMLREGQRVTFEATRGPKGLRAENVDV